MAGPDGWWFAPERALIRPEARLAVAADLHLGYEWARAAGGDMVPFHSLDETLFALEKLFNRTLIERLVVAGDLVESRRPCRRTTRQLVHLTNWLSARSVVLIQLAGNHDPPQNPPLPPTLGIEGWTIAHGHAAIEADRLIIGHYHPILRGPGVEAPCFLASNRLIVLPAFSQDAAGQDVTRLGLVDSQSDEQARVIALTGEDLLDFGPLGCLRRQLNRNCPGP